MKRLAAYFLMLASFLPMAEEAHSGILVEGTRVIFPERRSEQAVTLVNTNDYPVLVQDWVDNGEGDPDKADSPFIVLPAVFRLAAGERKSLRIIQGKTTLPSDRESVFWLNLYEIPPSGEKGNAGYVQVKLAMNTQIKIFYRPEKLVFPGETGEHLRFRTVQDGGHTWLVCQNLSSYYASPASLFLRHGDRDIPVQMEMDMMTPPLSQRRYQLRENVRATAGDQVKVTLINDRGFLHTRLFNISLE